jgi:hypothetical protein
MNKRSRNALGWLVLLCTVTAVPAVVACHKDEAAATAPSASASASASAATVASADPSASASAADSTTVVAGTSAAATASVPTPQDFESQAKTTVTPDTLEVQLDKIEKEINGH